MDLIRKYRAMEDEEVRVATKQYYGPFLRICFVFPCIDEGWLLITIAHSVLITISVISYAYLLWVTTYFLKDDFLTSGVEFHYFLLVTITAIFFFYANYKREIFCRLHKLMYKLYDYGDLDIPEEAKKGLKQIVWKQRLWLIPVIVIIGITASFMVAVGPWIDNLVDAGETRTTVNGVYMKTPIPMYFPIEIETKTVHYVAVGYQVVSTILLTPILGGIVVCYIVNCQFLAYEHRVLIDSIKHLFERSAKVYKQRYHDRKIDIPEICDHDGFQNCVTFCMKQNIQHHQRIREYYNTLAELVAVPLFLSLSVAAFILALALFTFIKKTNRIGLLVTTMLSVIGELAVIYVACFFGEEITTLGGEVNEAIYGIEWYYLNAKNKKMTISMQDITRHPFVIKAYLIFNCNMETFSSICNSAYSYFNMLSASSAKSNA